MCIFSQKFSTLILLTLQLSLTPLFFNKISQKCHWFFPIFPSASESMFFPPKLRLAMASPCSTTRVFLCAQFIFLALTDNVFPEFFLTLC